MENEKSKNLRVSNCHHSGYRTVDLKRKDGSYEEEKMYICDICNHECKVVELIVDDIQPEGN